MQISQKSSTFAVVIELERHIEILLLDNDCVIVPELGGFMARHCEAHYDSEDGLFLPPQRTIGFNPQLKINDSLLAQSYIEVYDISYPEAIRRIETEVNELKQHLATEGEYELNDIGRLKVNDEGKLEFEPCEAGILTPQLYGLNSVEIAPLGVSTQISKKENRLSDDFADTSKGLGYEDEKLPAEADDEDDGEKAITIKMSWVRNVVAVAAAFIAFFVMTTPVSNNVAENVNYSQINLPLIQRDSSKKPVDKVDTQAVKSVLSQRDTVMNVTEVAHSDEKENVDNTSVDQPERESGFCIVVASQVSKKGAETFVSILHKKGFADARVYHNNNIRRVVCGSFKTEAEAYQQLQVVHKTEGLSEAWVYKFSN